MTVYGSVPGLSTFPLRASFWLRMAAWPLSTRRSTLSDAVDVVGVVLAYACECAREAAQWSLVNRTWHDAFEHSDDLWRAIALRVWGPRRQRVPVGMVGFRSRTLALRELAPLHAGEVSVIENCEDAFLFRCPLLMERLRTTGELSTTGNPIMHCDVCDRSVFVVTDSAELQLRKHQRHCVIGAPSVFNFATREAGALTVAVVYDDDVCDAPAAASAPAPGHHAVSRDTAMRCINGLRQYFITSLVGEALVGPSAHPLLVEYNGRSASFRAVPLRDVDKSYPRGTDHHTGQRYSFICSLHTPPYPEALERCDPMSQLFFCAAPREEPHEQPGKPPPSTWLSDFGDDVTRRVFPRRASPFMGMMVDDSDW